MFGLDAPARGQVSGRFCLDKAAGYDMIEVDVEGADEELREELGWSEGEDQEECGWVAYRQN